MGVVVSGGAQQHTELAQFLRAMRARLQPQQVGLPSVGRRRTPGLRRQEVAELAAVSIDWYIRLEQGRVGTPGAAVLDALARALRLSPAERHHLHLIARGQVPLAPHVPAPVSDSLLILLDGMPLLPAYVIDFRLDILARNSAAAALFGEGFGAGELANAAHLLFLAPRMRRMQRDWARVAREMVGNLRANLARHHDDVRLRTLIAELGERSSEFAAWWQDHTVQQRAHGAKRIVHPAVGELTVCYDALATQEGSDQCLIVVTPADSAAEQSLRTLVAGRANQLAGPGVHAIAG